MSMSRSPVDGQDGAGPEKQQTLEEGVVEHVKQRRREGERRRELQAVGLEGQRKAEADEDDADIFDRAVGEQALEILFHHGVEDPHDGGDAAEEEHDHARRPGRRSQQIEDDANEAVDRDLGHDAAHQRRNVAWRRGMSERQPDMQRHKAGL